MIDIHKNVIRYLIKHRFRCVNKCVNNTTSLQIEMAQISLTEEKLD